MSRNWTKFYKQSLSRWLKVILYFLGNLTFPTLPVFALLAFSTFYRPLETWGAFTSIFFAEFLSFLSGICCSSTILWCFGVFSWVFGSEGIGVLLSSVYFLGLANLSILSKLVSFLLQPSILKAYLLLIWLRYSKLYFRMLLVFSN